MLARLRPSPRRWFISIVLLALQLLGSLGVFLFGMKYMSEGLQRVAGARLKSLLGKMTHNRFVAVGSGLALTAVIQSSTACTVMIVSFVSAELMSLTQAIGMIMGANIGTTLTAWMVSLLGFKVNISAFALPAVGVGLGFTFLRGERKRDTGEVLIGFGLLFLGLSLLRDTVPPVSDPEQLNWLTQLTGFGFGSILIFVLVGTVLTILLQSSTVTTTLTLTLAGLGWLSYDMAVAMILGDNLGTTITANLAAIGASTNAKRAARVHIVFNVIGVTWALLLFHVYLLPAVDFLVPGDPHVDFTKIQDDPRALAVASGVVTTHLAGIHTLFNISNTLIMLPFVGQLERIVLHLVPERPREKTTLRYLHPGLIETPELLLLQAGREMQHMTEVVREMFAASMRILTHPGEKLGRLVEETLEREEVVDDMEKEISELLVTTARAVTSESTANQITAMIQNTHRLERIGDHCAALVRIARRAHSSGTEFHERDLTELQTLGDLVNDALENLGKYLAGDATANDGETIEAHIDQMRRHLRTRHTEKLQDERSSVPLELAFLDTITHLEEIGDRALGIIRLSEAAHHSRREQISVHSIQPA